MDNRDYKNSSFWARQALWVDARDSDMYRVIAAGELAVHNYEEAIEHFELAVELNTLEPHRRFSLADAYLQAKRPEKARQVLKELLDLVPDYPGAAAILKSLDEDEEK